MAPVNPKVERPIKRKEWSQTEKINIWADIQLRLRILEVPVEKGRKQHLPWNITLEVADHYRMSPQTVIRIWNRGCNEHFDKVPADKIFMSKKKGAVGRKVRIDPAVIESYVEAYKTQSGGDFSYAKLSKYINDTHGLNIPCGTIHGYCQSIGIISKNSIKARKEKEITA